MRGYSFRERQAQHGRCLDDPTSSIRSGMPCTPGPAWPIFASLGSIVPQPRPCAPISCACGSPRWSTSCCAPCVASVSDTRIRRGYLRHDPTQAPQDRRPRTHQRPPHQVRDDLERPVANIWVRGANRIAAAARVARLSRLTRALPQRVTNSASSQAHRESIPRYAQRHMPDSNQRLLRATASFCPA